MAHVTTGTRELNHHSPYTMEPVTLLFRQKKQRYQVPHHLIKPYPLFVSRLERDPGTSIINLHRADEDLAHTVIHYLYTGEYQTLDDLSAHGIARRQQEYGRAVLAYIVATGYGMSGLAAQARRYMGVFEDAVDIRMVLVMARVVFSMIDGFRELFAGYLGYLKEKLEAAVEANEGFDDLIVGLGYESDHLVVRLVMSLYASRIAKLERENEGLKALTEGLREDQVIKLNDCQVIFEKAVPLPLVQEPAHAVLTPAISEASSSDTESLSSQIEFVKIRKDE